MASARSVDEYIASQPESVRAALVRVRKAIRGSLPDAEEVISYQTPTYKLQGEPVLNFAAWKQHYSLYAATAGVLDAFRRELASYDISRGTIRFPLSEPVPVSLIEHIAEFRGKEVARRGRSPAQHRQGANRCSGIQRR
jgi:uncharacterized protein YdhG (YjbR/CyaY superfamily)